MALNTTLKTRNSISLFFSWLFGAVVFATGIANLIWVHPVPALVYVLLSFLYFPPATAAFRRKFGFPVPLLLKILLGIVIILFTLGVSDLGDMID